MMERQYFNINFLQFFSYIYIYIYIYIYKLYKPPGIHQLDIIKYKRKIQKKYREGY